MNGRAKFSRAGVVALSWTGFLLPLLLLAVRPSPPQGTTDPVTGEAENLPVMMTSVGGRPVIWWETAPFAVDSLPGLREYSVESLPREALEARCEKAMWLVRRWFLSRYIARHHQELGVSKEALKSLALAGTARDQAVEPPSDRLLTLGRDYVDCAVVTASGGKWRVLVHVYPEALIRQLAGASGKALSDELESGSVWRTLTGPFIKILLIVDTDEGVVAPVGG